MGEETELMMREIKGRDGSETLGNESVHCLWDCWLQVTQEQEGETPCGAWEEMHLTHCFLRQFLVSFISSFWFGALKPHCKVLLSK